MRHQHQPGSGMLEQASINISDIVIGRSWITQFCSSEHCARWPSHLQSGLPGPGLYQEGVAPDVHLHHHHLSKNCAAQNGHGRTTQSRHIL